MSDSLETQSKKFYTEIYEGDSYKRNHPPEMHPFYNTVQKVIKDYHLENARALEVGCGTGHLQDIVENYTGLDVTDTLKSYFHKPFVISSAAEMPFKNNSFDLIFSYAVLEHIPNPELALNEINRVLYQGGFLILCPAWQCRPWAANGYPVRPYSDFNLWGKIVKASIPIRDSVIFRSIYIFPKRFVRLIIFLYKQKEMKFTYSKLKPNYEKFWMSDSDAVNSMDPFEAILWFISRDYKCVNYNTLIKQFFVRSGVLIFQK